MTTTEKEMKVLEAHTIALQEHTEALRSMQNLIEEALKGGEVGTIRSIASLISEMADAAIYVVNKADSIAQGTKETVAKLSNVSEEMRRAANTEVSASADMMQAAQRMSIAADDFDMHPVASKPKGHKCLSLVAFWYKNKKYKNL